MAQQVKTPRLKEAAPGELNLGGAPIFGDDLLMIQDNNLKDFVNTNESLRDKLIDKVLYYNMGGPLIQNFENGLILSGLEYDNTDPANPIVNPGYILSGGEVCYFPGATFATGLVLQGLIYLFKGAENTVNRVFNDGGNKQLLTSFDCTVEQGTWDVNGPTMQVGTAIVPTDQVVVIACGISAGGDGLAESTFSKRQALKINEVAGRVSSTPWVAASMDYPLGTNMPYFVSRINPDGGTEIRGEVLIDKALTPLFQPDERIATLAASGRDITANRIIVFGGNGEATPHHVKVVVTFGGSVRIVEPDAGWAALPTVFLVVVNGVVHGNKTLVDYQYDTTFMDVT